jgi:hypothetical protein
LPAFQNEPAGFYADRSNLYYDLIKSIQNLSLSDPHIVRAYIQNQLQYPEPPLWCVKYFETQNQFTHTIEPPQQSINSLGSAVMQSMSVTLNYTTPQPFAKERNFDRFSDMNNTNFASLLLSSPVYKELIHYVVYECEFLFSFNFESMRKDLMVILIKEKVIQHDSRTHEVLLNPLVQLPVVPFFTSEQIAKYVQIGQQRQGNPENFSEAQWFYAYCPLFNRFSPDDENFIDPWMSTKLAQRAMIALMNCFVLAGLTDIVNVLSNLPELFGQIFLDVTQATGKWRRKDTFYTPKQHETFFLRLRALLSQVQEEDHSDLDLGDDSDNDDMPSTPEGGSSVYNDRNLYADNAEDYVMRAPMPLNLFELREQFRDALNE